MDTTTKIHEAIYKAIQEPEKIQWLSKDEAAAILKISPRRVLEYAQAGALQSIKQRDPATSQIATRLHAGDVERLREERENPQPQPSQPSREVAREVREAAKLQTPALLETSADKGLEGFENHSWPLPMYLTIGGAVRYSGLGPEHIQQAARDGRVNKVGRKYRRADLDKL